MTNEQILDSTLTENNFIPVDFSKIRVGTKYLTDATYKLGTLQRVNPTFADKINILRAIHNSDLIRMREISNYFYKISGIYQRLCRYMAYMYRYDWLVTPYFQEEKSKNEKSFENLITNFKKVLNYIDNFNVKKNFGEIALKIIKNGSYYGYLIKKKDKVVLQELPVNYCRSRFFVENQPVVEFNMSYFDEAFPNAEMRKKILSIFPPDFEKGYRLYKQGKIVGDRPGEKSPWYVLQIGSVVRFYLNEEEFPPLIAVIPAIIDLDMAQDLDRKKMAQQLLKIIIQKMPIDKNGDLIFDVDEAQQLHNNAVQMLSKAIGIDVLTTFADVQVATMTDNKTSTTKDDLQKVERAIYNEAGVSQMQFNTDGNLALEKSILNDEATLWNLIQQFEEFLNLILSQFNRNKNKIFFKVQILPTTIYNYKDLSKLYKEQTQLGYSKMLPQIALGQSQNAVLANAYFENDVLDLVNVFIPPMMSSTMNAESLVSIRDGNQEGSSGRPEKPDDEKSEKTIMNEQSQS